MTSHSPLLEFCPDFFLCLRAILNFESNVSTKSAWSIYRDFLRSGASCANICQFAVKKEVFHRIAYPTKDTFAPIKQILEDTLTEELENFHSSEKCAETRRQMVKSRKWSMPGFKTNITFRKKTNDSMLRVMP